MVNSDGSSEDQYADGNMDCAHELSEGNENSIGNWIRVQLDFKSPLPFMLYSGKERGYILPMS